MPARGVVTLRDGARAAAGDTRLRPRYPALRPSRPTPTDYDPGGRRTGPQTVGTYGLSSTEYR